MPNLNHHHHHYLVPYVILALGTYVRGLFSETPNQCSTQVVDLPPGQEHNLTIPCAKYVSAELQLSNGSSRSLSAGSTVCASTTTKTDLQLYLSDSAPQGSLNLTIFCLNVAPLCYSFNVEAPNQSTQKHDYSLREVCSLNSATVDTNSSSLAQAQAMPPNKQDFSLGGGSSTGSSTASSGQPVNPGVPVRASPTDSGSQPLSQGQPTGATPTGSSPSTASSDQPVNPGVPVRASPTDSGSQPLSQGQPVGATPTGSSPSVGSSGQAVSAGASPGSPSMAATQNASAVPGGGATTAPPGNGQAMAPPSGSPQSATAGGSGLTPSSPQSTCLCPS